ncbi:MAG: hypothetical protein EB107_04275, partial [Proteobacteria bacterium]|nr:hypothetical protein [Pseudomonadota bacterium]
NRVVAAAAGSYTITGTPATIGRTFTLSVLFSGGQVSLCVPPVEPEDLAAHLVAIAAVARQVVVAHLASTRMAMHPAGARDAQVSLGLDSGL